MNEVNEVTVHCRCRHTKPLFCRQLLSFHVPSWYISTQFSFPTSPSWNASLGSPGAQFVKPRDVWSVQAHSSTIRMGTWSAHGVRGHMKDEGWAAYMSRLWWGRSRCCGIWCSWCSWWTPPRPGCESRLILLRSPLGRCVSPLATSNPLSGRIRCSSIVRTAASPTNTSRLQEPALMEACLRRDWRQAFVIK